MGRKTMHRTLKEVVSAEVVELLLLQ